MTTFTTKIKQIKALPHHIDLDLENVVFSVCFEVEGIDGDFKHSVTRDIGIGAPDPTNFIPIDQLNETQVLAFVDAALAPDDMQCAKNEINDAIEAQKTPTKTTVVRTWPL